MVYLDGIAVVGSDVSGGDVSALRNVPDGQNLGFKIILKKLG